MCNPTGTIRFSQVLKGAVGTTLRQNEAELKFSMEIDHQISSTNQAGKIRLAELIINDILLSILLMSKFNQSDFPCLFCG